MAVVSKAKATTRSTKAPKPSTATTSLSEAQLRALFDTIDKDGSGAVSRLELRIVMETMGERLRPAEFRALFGEGASELYRWIEGAEGNSDGELTSDEWVLSLIHI